MSRTVDTAPPGMHEQAAAPAADQTIDLQAPPYTHLATPFIYGSASVRLVPATGQNVLGELIFFNTTEERLGLRVAGSADIVEFDLGRIKSLEILSGYEIADAPQSEGRQIQLLPLKDNLRKFRVDFLDGTRVEGNTLGSRIDKNGIHFYRLAEGEEDSKTCHHYFVSNQSFAQYQIGDRIGAVLVGNASISQDDLSEALADMQSSRATRIGEYLLSHQVVDAETLAVSLERQKSMPNLRLGEILMSEHLISETQLESALKEQKRSASMPLGELLVRKGLLTREQLQRSLAIKLGIPFVNLKEFVIDPDTLKLVSATLAYRFNIVPL